MADHTKDVVLNLLTQVEIIEANLEIDRVIGCVVYPATELAGPGIVQHIDGDRFSIGELDGSRSDRIKEISRRINIRS